MNGKYKFGFTVSDGLFGFWWFIRQIRGIFVYVIVCVIIHSTKVLVL